MEKTLVKAKTVLVLPDCHLRPPSKTVPSGEDTKSLKAVEHYVRDHKWDEVIQLGDLLDLDCISFHNHGKPLLVEGQRLQGDYDYANEWLDRWHVATPGAKWTILEGNHEHRATRYSEAFPVLQGSLEVPRALRLKERGINWVPYWSKGDLYSTGNLFYGHGRSTLDAHCKKNVGEYGVCLLTGHTHTSQEYSMTRYGDDKTICAKSIGCLCRYNQPYLMGRNTKWQQAFDVVHVQANGFYNDFVIKLFDHRFTSPEGVLYRP